MSFIACLCRSKTGNCIIFKAGHLRNEFSRFGLEKEMAPFVV